MAGKRDQVPTLRAVKACALVAFLFVCGPTFAQGSVTGFYEDASRYHAAGDYSAAMIQLKNALSLDTQHLPSLLLLGEVLLQLGAPGAAATAFSDALLLGADANHATLGLADAYLSLGAYRRLVEELDPSQLSGNAKAELLGYRALALRELGDDRASDEALTRALAINASARAANIALAETHLAAGDASAAKKISGLLIERFPSDARIWSLHARVLVELGDTGGAIDTYSRALELNENLATARIARAGLFFAAGDIEKADEDIDFVRSNFPGDPRGVFLKARILEREGDRDGALEQYSLCANILSAIDSAEIARDPQLTVMAAIANSRTGANENAIQLLSAFQSSHAENAMTGAMLAEMLVTAGDGDEALAVLKPLLVSAPDSRELRALKARALSSGGRHQEAIAVWRQLEADGLSGIDFDARFAFDQVEGGELDEGIARFESVLARDGSRTQDRYYLAQAHLDAGNHSRAIAEAQVLAGAAPENAAFAELLARTHIRAGDLQEAQDILSAAVTRLPNVVSLGIALAEVEITRGELQRARQRLAALYARSPDNVAVLTQQARLERLAGDLEQARKLAEEAIRADGTVFPPRELLVTILLELGEDAAAIESARIARLRLRDQIEAAFLYADTLAKLGEKESALAEYKLIGRRGDVDHADLFRAARAQLRLGALGEASASLYQAQLRKPESLLYRAASTDLMLRMDNHAGALDAATSLIADYPAEAAPQLLMARAYSGLGAETEALHHFEKAVELAPDDRAILLRFAKALEDADLGTRAETLLSEWLESNPADGAVQAALADLLMKQAQWTRAARLLQDMQRAQPDNPQLLNELAIAQQRLGQPEAVTTAQRAHDLSPQSPQINDTLGWIHLEQGRPEDALPYLRDAVARRANDASLRYHLGAALHALGRYREAVGELRTALRLSTDFSERPAAIALLDELERPPT